MDKRRLSTLIARYSLNPLVKALAAIGPLPAGMVLLETVGRTSGEPRRVPVGGRRIVAGGKVLKHPTLGLRTLVP